MNTKLLDLQRRAGIHFMGAMDADFQLDGIASDLSLAMDAQPGMITVSNSGIPAFLSTYVDPKLIEVLVAPMKAALITGGEIKKGDWVTETAMFPMVESTGETSSYGDYSESGRAGANTNFPQRQSYHYQVMTRWGEKELERAGLAKIDWANRVNIASALTLNKFQNKSYFFGVAGLQNYGLLNDAALSAAGTPAVKAAGAGNNTWGPLATGLEVLADIQAMFALLQTQLNGSIELDTAMTLAMSPASEVALTKTTQYNVNVADMLKKNFPNMKVVTAPEYATGSGNLAQLIVDSIEAQPTVEVAFTEKMRAHPVVVASSSFKQKKSQGTWGAIIYRPAAIAQMLGV